MEGGGNGADPMISLERSAKPSKRESGTRHCKNETNPAKRGRYLFVLSKRANDDNRTRRDVKVTIHEVLFLFEALILFYCNHVTRASKCQSNAISRKTRGARIFCFCSQVLLFYLFLYCYVYHYYYTSWYEAQVPSGLCMRSATKDRTIAYRVNNHREMINARPDFIYRHFRRQTRMSGSTRGGSIPAWRKCDASGLSRIPMTRADDCSVIANDSKTESRCASVRPGERLTMTASNEYFILRKHGGCIAKAESYFLIYRYILKSEKRLEYAKELRRNREIDTGDTMLSSDYINLFSDHFALAWKKCILGLSCTYVYRLINNVRKETNNR